MSSSDVPIIRGRLPRPGQRTYSEYVNYENGAAEQDAAARSTDPAIAWRSVRDQFGPFAGAALDRVLAHPELGPRVHGNVADIGAGTCWLAGRIARLDRVDKVYAQDLSEGFLRRVGIPVYESEGGDPHKLTLVVSDFNDIPLENATLDAAFLFAAFHHSLSQIPTLIDILRCLKRTGTLFIYESPVSIIGLEKMRRWSENVPNVSEIPTTLNDIRYCLAMAGATEIRVLPLDFSRTRIRKLGRFTLRFTRLENWVRPAQYLITAGAPNRRSS
jgi:SAM-dependent methyltransferase